MREKWLNFSFFQKNIFISIFYSLLLVFISLILLINNTSWIYGTSIGIFALFLSYLFIGIILKKMPFSKILFWTILMVRIILFLLFYLLIIFLINNKYDNLDRFLYPVNTFFFLLVYSISFYSYITIWLIDLILERKK